MQKILLVLKHELITTLSRRSFLIFGVLLPIAAMIGLSAFNRFSVSAGQQLDSEPGEQADVGVDGYVDLSGLIVALPEDVDPKQLLAFEQEADAKAALEAGEIGGYFLIPADYLQSGELGVVRDDYSLFSSDSRDWIMHWTLTYNLLGRDLEQAQRVVRKGVVQVEDLSAEQAGEADCTRPGPYCNSNPVLRMLPLFVTVLYFVILMNGAGILMRSVSSEKQNRVMEVLLVSVSSQQLLVGKIVGLGLAALAAAAAWVVSGYLALGVGAAVAEYSPWFFHPALGRVLDHRLLHHGLCALRFAHGRSRCAGPELEGNLGCDLGRGVTAVPRILRLDPAHRCPAWHRGNADQPFPAHCADRDGDAADGWRDPVLAAAAFRRLVGADCDPGDQNGGADVSC